MEERDEVQRGREGGLRDSVVVVRLEEVSRCGSELYLQILCAV